MKNFFRLIMGITAFLIIIPVGFAGFCNPPDRTESIYEDIYCDIAMGGNEKMDDEIFEAIAEQLGYDITTTGKGKLTKLIYDTGNNINCEYINQFITNENIEYDDLPVDILNACRSESDMDPWSAWNIIFSKLKTAYDKEKVLYHTKKTLEYEFKASENFYDGELRDFGDAPFDLIVDLNLIETVLFGSQAKWDTNADIWKWPSDEDDEADVTDDVDMQDLAPPEEEDVEPETTPETEGITVEESMEEGVIPECVPADSPNADHGDNPNSSYTNPYCGNGIIDILMGEQCDDGNRISGDGCNQYCMPEESGADLICQDPEAITFKSFDDAGNQDLAFIEEGDDESENNEPFCPPGTLPNKKVTITGPPPIEPEYPEADQSENYPGPSVGGTFKDFPVTNPPPCPPGYSELKFEYLGKEESECIKTELCGDFNAVRDFLFGPDWMDDENKIQIAESIEAMVCINISKQNRPESPYQVNEGCVDCHIIAMADSLDKALESNVTPLCNTSSSFSISSKWGPTFSFSLNTAVKTRIKTWLTKTTEETIKKTDEEIKKIEQENQPPKQSNIPLSENPAEELSRTISEKENSEKLILEELKNYHNSGNTINDQEFYSRISILLGQMEDIFENMQGQFNSMATIQTQELAKKPACK